MHIRTFRNGDEPALRTVFHSSVHTLACKDYTAEQLDAWAPRQYDAAQWGERLRGNQPFIAEIEGHIAAYAGLQASGYIDHFFVAGTYAGRLAAGRALQESPTMGLVQYCPIKGSNGESYVQSCDAGCE